MRARISISGLNMTCRARSLTRSPLMYTSRLSRMESRYCVPVRIMAPPDCSQSIEEPAPRPAPESWRPGHAADARPRGSGQPIEQRIHHRIAALQLVDGDEFVGFVR